MFRVEDKEDCKGIQSFKGIGCKENQSDIMEMLLSMGIAEKEAYLIINNTEPQKQMHFNNKSIIVGNNSHYLQ